MARDLNEMFLDKAPDDLVTADEYCRRARLKKASYRSYKSQNPDKLPPVVPGSDPPVHKVADIREVHERLKGEKAERYKGKTLYLHELVKQIEDKTYAEASRMGHEYASAEHLLRVVLDDPNAIELVQQRRPNADLDVIRSAVAEYLEVSFPTVPEGGQTGRLLAPDAVEVLKIAKFYFTPMGKPKPREREGNEERRKAAIETRKQISADPLLLGKTRPDGAHVLMALTIAKNTAARQILRKYGVQPFRTKLVAWRPEPESITPAAFTTPVQESGDAQAS